jgi:hypothetical protein
VRSSLRDLFAQWGLPGAVRVDNGFPWGSTGDFPTELALWLIGLGIEIIWNPPRQPQKNGVVERSQGTAKRWAEPQQCASPGELQQRLDAMDRLQREAYPRSQGDSRWTLFPGLRHSGRAYRPSREHDHWHWPTVAAHLAGYVVPRRIDHGGLVSLYNRPHYIGTKWQDTTVYVSFDPQSIEWVFRDQYGTQLRTKPAPELCAERIQALQVIRRPGGKPHVRINGET